MELKQLLEDGDISKEEFATQRKMLIEAHRKASAVLGAAELGEEEATAAAAGGAEATDATESSSGDGTLPGQKKKVDNREGEPRWDDLGPCMDPSHSLVEALEEEAWLALTLRGLPRIITQPEIAAAKAGELYEAAWPRGDAPGRFASHVPSSPEWLQLEAEISQCNQVVGVVTSSLAAWGSSLRGEGGGGSQDDQLVAIQEDVVSCRVPAAWGRLSSPSLLPLGGWLADLTKRTDQLRSWLHQGPPGSVWLPGLYQPRRFLATLVQAEARRHMLPLDAVDLSTVLTGRTAEQLGDCLGDHWAMHGLVIEGARVDWSTGQLHDAFPGPGGLQSPLPAIEIQAKPKGAKTLSTPAKGDKEGKEAAAPPHKAVYRAPVFATASRAHTVTTIELEPAVEKPVSFWVLRGVAALLEAGS